MEARVQAKSLITPTHKLRNIPNSTHSHTETVALQFSRYMMTGGYAPCRLVLADPSSMQLMERDKKNAPFFSFQSDSDGR